MLNPCQSIFSKRPPNKSIYNSILWAKEFSWITGIIYFNAYRILAHKCTCTFIWRCIKYSKTSAFTYIKINKKLFYEKRQALRLCSNMDVNIVTAVNKRVHVLVHIGLRTERGAYTCPYWTEDRKGRLHLSILDWGQKGAPTLVHIGLRTERGAYTCPYWTEDRKGCQH